jgi:hypothetical protein
MPSKVSKANVESLEEDFIVEEIDFSGNESGNESELEAAEALEEFPADELIVPAKKAKIAMDKASTKAKDSSKIGNSKRKKLTFDDLAIPLSPLPLLHSHTYTCLLDTLYSSAPKPLYVKSHTNVKVLIVCSSALRCLEVLRDLKKGMSNVRVAKLFARHMKVAEQIEVRLIFIEPKFSELAS